MDGLPPWSWSSIGPVGLLTLVVILILLGRLIPWVTWRAWLTAWNDRLADAKAENEKLHTALGKLNESLTLYNAQITQLLEGQKSVQTLLINSLNGREVSGRDVVETQDS